MHQIIDSITGKDHDMHYNKQFAIVYVTDNGDTRYAFGHNRGFNDFTEVIKTEKSIEEMGYTVKKLLVFPGSHERVKSSL